MKNKLSKENLITIFKQADKNLCKPNISDSERRLLVRCKNKAQMELIYEHEYNVLELYEY